jgi:hypothetical protein
MPDGRWTVWVCNGVTGKKELDVTSYWVSSQWERRLSDVGSASHTFSHQLLSQQAGRVMSKTQWVDKTYPSRNVIVQCWNDRPIFAGYVAQSEIDETTITVRSLEFRSILAFRLPFRVENATDFANDLETTGSMQGVMNFVVRRGTYRAGDALYTLPVVVGPDDIGGLVHLKVENWRFKTIDEIMRELEQRENGSDSDFEPRWKPSDPQYLEWVFKVGDPDVSGATYEFAPGSPKSGLTSWKKTIDGTEMLTGHVLIGEGSEQDTKNGQKAIGSVAGTPFRDTATAAKDIADQALLDERAAAYVNSHAYALEQISFTHRADGAQGIPRLGDRYRLLYTDHFYEDDGVQTTYVVGMRGTHELEVTPDLQLLGA